MSALTTVVLGLGLFELAPLQLSAQASAGPQSYSFTEMNSMIVPDMTVKVYRDGSKELFLQTRPASAGSPKGYSGGMYFDFQAHFQYTWDATNGTPACGRQAYAGSTATVPFDIVSGSGEMMADLAKATRTAGGRDTVNGAPAVIFNFTDTVRQVKMKVWLAEKTKYLLRIAATSKGAAPVTLLDVRSLSFAKPPASAFTVPASCK